MLPILEIEGGELVGGEARECQSAGSADRAALGAVRGVVGAIAFSRTGDPKTGGGRDPHRGQGAGRPPRDLWVIANRVSLAGSGPA
jgi:hypothetical protein